MAIEVLIEKSNKDNFKIRYVLNPIEAETLQGHKKKYIRPVGLENWKSREAELASLAAVVVQLRKRLP